MTVKEFAASRGVSKQLVYQNVRSTGKQISELTDGKGQITESGLEFLQSIVPDKSAQTEQSSGSAEKQTKESGSEQQSLLDTIKNLSASLDKAHEHIDKLTARLEQEQINLSQEQHLHAITKQELHDLRLRLGAGSPEGESEKPIPADVQEEQSPETTESETVKTDPEGESPAEKKQDPEKAEGETAPAAESSEASSPVTDDQKQEQKPEQKPEEKTKATLKQRLRFLFTGEK